jgi:hypothetical protein
MAARATDMVRRSSADPIGTSDQSTFARGRKVSFQILAATRSSSRSPGDLPSAMQARKTA